MEEVATKLTTLALDMRSMGAITLRNGGFRVVALVQTVAYLGLEARSVEVQCQLAAGMPRFTVVGLPDKAVAETYYAPYSESHPDLLRAAWGFGVEAGTQAVRLILSGIFDKHPGLKIVLGHLGEAIPFLLPRIDDSLKRKGNAPVCFAEVFKSNFYVTTSGFFSTNALTCCLEELGPDRVLFAVDWPYADNVQGVTWLSGAPIAADVKQAIFYDNAINLLKL